MVWKGTAFGLLAVMRARFALARRLLALVTALVVARELPVEGRRPQAGLPTGSFGAVLLGLLHRFCLVRLFSVFVAALFA